MMIQPPFMLSLLFKYAFSEYTLIVYCFTVGLSENILIFIQGIQFSCCSSLFSISVEKKNTDQNQLGEERVYFTLHVTVHHPLREAMAETQGRNLEAGIQAEDREK